MVWVSEGEWTGLRATSAWRVTEDGGHAHGVASMQSSGPMAQLLACGVLAHVRGVFGVMAPRGVVQCGRRLRWRAAHPDLHPLLLAAWCEHAAPHVWQLALG